VIYEKDFNKQELPVLAIELDGKEHFDDEIVKERDRKKKEICEKHGFTLIRVENSYARRYCYIKDILVDFFKR
jgi:very-short-patch-repair endonuclease